MGSLVRLALAVLEDCGVRVWMGVGLDEEIVAGVSACVCTAAAAGGGWGVRLCEGGFGVRVAMGCRCVCFLFFLCPLGDSFGELGILGVEDRW